MNLQSTAVTSASKKAPGVLARSVFSGSIASLATSAAAAALGQRISGSAAAPINATSHVLWGDEAVRAQDGLSARYTGLGLVINSASAIFWALFFERVVGRNAKPARILTSAAAVTATAYLVDYHLVPKRLTPGWELRLPRRSLAGIYGALGLSLAVAGLLELRASKAAQLEARRPQSVG